MEKVVVVREVPGMLKLGDVLQSFDGGDFTLNERFDNNERFINIDYITVSENTPEYFDYVTELVESKCSNCLDTECNCDMKEEEQPSRIFFDQWRTPLEIKERKEFFQRQLDNAFPGSEAEIVYSNLIWFIEWMKKEKELLK